MADIEAVSSAESSYSSPNSSSCKAKADGKKHINPISKSHYFIHILKKLNCKLSFCFQQVTRQSFLCHQTLTYKSILVSKVQTQKVMSTVVNWRPQSTINSTWVKREQSCPPHPHHTHLPEGYNFFLQNYTNRSLLSRHFFHSFVFLNSTGWITSQILTPNENTWLCSTFVLLVEE